jgi:hypothetical protein
MREAATLPVSYLSAKLPALESGQQNLRVQKWVVTVAVVLFILKMIAWILTHSVAILTDALESTVNVVAGFIGLYSLYVAAKPRDENHPYGHGKAEFLSAAVEGTLISIAGLLIVYKAIDNFINPTPIPSTGLRHLSRSRHRAHQLHHRICCGKKRKKKQFPRAYRERKASAVRYLVDGGVNRRTGTHTHYRQSVA